MSLHDRLFKAVMRLLPAEFRGDYGREMEAHFRAERRDAAGGLAIARLWAATLADLVRTAPAEHWDVLSRDLGYAMRMMVRRPALTAAALVTLTLGIGANTAIFSVVDGVWLSPLPYPDPDRLVFVKEMHRNGPNETTGYYSFDALRARQQSFESISAMSDWSAVLTGEGQDAERVNGARVTWDYFHTLGIRPALGRDFDRAEDQPTRRRAVLLGDGLWRRRFNADPGVVGRSVTINDVAYTVAGVMPRQMNDLVSGRTLMGTDMWTLLGYEPSLPQACRSCRHIFTVARVREGVSLSQAEADAARVYQSLAAEFPRDYVNPGAMLTPIRDQFLGPVRPVLALLWAAVGLLLLMACANIANLLLIRASEREEEIAIRRALGVSPARLLRQFLTESLLLSAIGGAAGTVLAVWATRALVASGPDAIPRLDTVAVNGRVWLYAMATSVVTGVLFGLAPARTMIARGWSQSRPGADRAAASRVTAGPAAWRQRARLVGLNVALSTVLLVGCGLLVRSFVRLLAVEPGFNPHGVLTMEVELSGQAYNSLTGIARFYDELTARLAALPGVASVGVTTQLPLTGSIDRWGITVEGRAPENPEASPSADRYGVAGDYFRVMNIPLLRGRFLEPGDGAGAPSVVVIGRTMADQLWPGEDPIGRRITLAGGPGNPPRTIVGIVGDVRHDGLHLPVSLQAYMPQVQAPWPQSGMTVIMRMRDGTDPLTMAGAAREQVRALDARQPVTQIRTHDTIVAASVATRQFILVLIALFAATALFLAVVGLYGALSYVVSQRQREIGVRVALGAGARDIRRLVLAQGLRPVAFGLLAGAAIAILAARLMTTLLFSVGATDAVAYAAALALVALSAVAACLLPARRAARIEPAVTLRAQ